MDAERVSEPSSLQQAQSEEQRNIIQQQTNTSEGTSTTDNLKAATVHSMEYHRQALKEKIESGEHAGKGQNLFAKALGKKAFESKLNAANDEPSTSTDQAEKIQD
ncbi:hypothetical protein KEM54_002758 [Ascosphaera aggregata]|nr:hypothetical protein KEM54_002758 [Ascosphaera aggregata]